MINTRDFQTKSEILEMQMPKINGNNQYKGKTIVALDGGYSSVKGVSPNKIFKIHSYAKKAPKDLEVVSKVRPFDIQLRDNKTNELWLVGDAAMALMDQNDIDSTTDASLFTRYRYDSDVFKVIMTAGLAIGLLGTTAGNEIFLQTGLPATYKDRDESKIKAALIGDYDIEIKVGNNDWVNFQFSLDNDHISVMEQPQGTLVGTVYSKDGAPTPQGLDILGSGTIILDIGFGTEDIFCINRGYKQGHDTYSDTAMRAVFEEVINRLKKDYDDADFKVFEFQNYLETGEAPCFNVEETSIEMIQFADILEKVNAEFSEKSVKRLLQEYDNLTKYKYLIVTGGTGESRFNLIKESLKRIPTLTVLPGNVSHPELGFSYSNVIGYYMFRYSNLAAQLKNAEKLSS